MVKHTKHPHLFVAVPLPDNIKSVLAAWSTAWRNRWPFSKWVHPADYHITLHFLGGCSQGDGAKIKQQLAQTMPSLAPFSIEIDHLGFFGQQDKPRILWAGVRGEVDALQRLRDGVVTELEPLGFPTEKRPYRPHITMAKKYKRNDFPADQLTAIPISQPKRSLRWEVDHFVLYQTHLDRAPMYEVIERYSL